MKSFADIVFSRILPNNNDIAVIDSNLKKFSYHDLYFEVEKITSLFQKHGLKKGHLIIIKTSKTFNGLAYLLACIKAEIVYIPVDVDSPKERFNQIIINSDSNAIIHPDYSLDIIHKKTIKNPYSGICILYTSGSTGIPKGVFCSADGMLSFIKWANTEFNITSNDIITSFAPFYFDLSVFDIFSCLINGASLWLIDKALASNIRLLGQQALKIKPSIWYSTPTMYSLLSEYGKLSSEYCPRIVLFAGEVFPVLKLNKLRKVWKSAIYYNLYGPTETNVCTYYKLPEIIEENRKDPYPIGIPCSYSSYKIIGNELHISGNSLMIGYFNDQQSTNSKIYIDNQQKWYKTGDAVVEKDSLLYYEGRLDRMVKRRGYRIELGEIEHILYTNQQLNQVAVISVNEDSEIKIIAFYSGNNVGQIELKIFCNNALPYYMIPDKFIYLDKLPLTSNGKLDYSLLKAKKS